MPEDPGPPEGAALALVALLLLAWSVTIGVILLSELHRALT